MPDLGVAVSEDDGYDPVRMDNPARFGECPGDGRVVVVPSAVVRRCLPRPEPFDDDFFGFLLNAELVGREREPRSRRVEGAFEPHVEEVRRVRIVDHVVVRRVGHDGRHRCVGERKRQRRTALQVRRAPGGTRCLIAEHGDRVVGERGPCSGAIAESGLEVVVGEAEARLIGEDVVGLHAVRRCVLVGQQRRSSCRSLDLAHED